MRVKRGGAGNDDVSDLNMRGASVLETPYRLNSSVPQSISANRFNADEEAFIAASLDDIFAVIEEEEEDDGWYDFSNVDIDDELVGHWFHGIAVADVQQKDWKKVPVAPIKFVEHGGTEKLEGSFQAECKMLEEEMRKKLNIPHDTEPTLEQLFDAYYSENDGLFASVFMKHVDLPYDEFLVFLYTVMELMIFGNSISWLHSIRAVFTTSHFENVMDESTWTETWRNISNNERAHTSIHSSGQTLWQSLQQAFNTTNKFLFLGTRDKFNWLRLVLDDDKGHCECRALEKFWGNIKRVKHVVSNRFGYNIHTLASSTTALIYGVHVESVEDKGSFDCLKSVLSVMFSVHGFTTPTLEYILIGLDRGYGSKDAIFWIVTMDKWRKRTNKSQGSFKIFVYYLQQQVVKSRLNGRNNLARMTTTPRTPANPSQSASATFQGSSRTNSNTLSTPIRVRLVPEHEVTNQTPKRPENSSTHSLDVGSRIKGCRGHLLKVCTSSGYKRKKSCYRCKSSTSYQCSGCHLYFCCKPPDPSKILDSIPDSWKRTPDVIEVNMGTATKWVKKDNGKRSRADVAVVQYAVPTCHLMAHLSEAYVEEEVSIQPGTS